MGTSDRYTLHALLRGLMCLKVADHLGDVRDAENVWLYPAMDEVFKRLGATESELRELEHAQTYDNDDESTWEFDRK